MITHENIQTNVDAVVVGAGFAGMYLLHRLRGLGLTTQVIEAAGDVGGTWYWNRYPGARCDAESILYSYSFSPELEQEWSWSERFATQPEILRYAQHVADRFDLRRDISFNTRVEKAVYDPQNNLWAVTTDAGVTVQARWCIMATGNLSVARMPDIAGTDNTRLPVYHTGHWPHEGVDFTGLDVAVIGTGSSAIQAIPEIAKQAAHVTVYQRTPSFSVPARNAPIDPVAYQGIKACYPELRKSWRLGDLVGSGEPLRPGSTFYSRTATAEVSPEEQQAEYERRWNSGGAYFVGAFSDMIHNEDANAVAADFIRAKIKEIVKDPVKAELLTPRGTPVGTKRIVVDTDYYETFNRPNVTLVDARATPIEAVTEEGIRTSDQSRKHDAVVFATGFDAMTGALTRISIDNGQGLTLKDKWSAGPRTYLGLMTAGFPNFFLITGPGSPSVLGNVLCHIEQHVEFVSDLIADMLAKGEDVVNVDCRAEDAWVERVNANAAQTLYPKANSWYLGANVPGKPRVFMPFVGGIGLYREICEEVVNTGYAGFIRQTAAVPADA